MAADRLRDSGYNIAVFDQLKTPARKFLIAGIGGLNLTHSEPSEKFVTRYGDAQVRFETLLSTFSPGDLRNWADELGAETFIGSSGRVFPKAMKATPLLREWLARLAGTVSVRLGHRWIGFEDDVHRFLGPDHRQVSVRSRATLLAMGGASWPRLGATGRWAEILRSKGIRVQEFAPSNCGFDVPWSDNFKQRASGVPLKNIRVSFDSMNFPGELIITSYGVEGTPIYALSSKLRRHISEHGVAQISLDLKANLSHETLMDRIARKRSSQSWAGFLKNELRLPDVTYSLLREAIGDFPREPAPLALLLKSLPLRLTAPRPLDRAISSAGGIVFDELDDSLMLKKLPGVFAAGEMVDWEAPTGGYLLQGCFSMGVVAADGIRRYLQALK